jgi:hypothetical protein
VSLCVSLSAFAFLKCKIFLFGIHKTRCGAIEVLIFLSEILPHHSRRFDAKWSFFFYGSSRLHLYLCVCVCVCVRERERGGELVASMQDSTSLTPATSSGSLGRELSRRNTASSSSASSLPDDHEGCGRFSNISSSSNGSSYSMHASRVLWVAGMNGGPDNDVHGLKIIFQQIIGPGDHLVALVLFDRIPSECTCCGFPSYKSPPPPRSLLPSHLNITCLAMFILQKPTCLAPSILQKPTCVATSILQKPISSYVHSAKTYV